MANDPAFLFYSKDFLTGVSDLTMEERGQYITLLALQHQKGHLTTKAIKITVPNISEDVLSKFSIDDEGKYFNERLELEANKRAEHSRKQKERALKGWEKRKNQSCDNTTANAAALPLVNVNGNVIENESNKGVPSFQEFKEYALTHKSVSEQELKLKYEAWKVNGWKTGGKNPRKIKNWKTTLLNSLKYMDEVTPETKEDREARELMEQIKEASLNEILYGNVQSNNDNQQPPSISWVSRLPERPTRGKADEAD